MLDLEFWLVSLWYRMYYLYIFIALTKLQYSPYMTFCSSWLFVFAFGRGIKSFSSSCCLFIHHKICSVHRSTMFLFWFAYNTMYIAISFVFICSFSYMIIYWFIYVSNIRLVLGVTYSGGCVCVFVYVSGFVASKRYLREEKKTISYYSRSIFCVCGFLVGPRSQSKRPTILPHKKIVRFHVRFWLVNIFVCSFFGGDVGYLMYIIIQFCYIYLFIQLHNNVQ